MKMKIGQFKKMMIIVMVMVFIASSVRAQTIMAIKNGIWNDVANWDCACIPGPATDVVIGNTLTINVSGDVTINSVTINSQAVFTINDTFTVTTFVAIDGLFKNNGIVHIAGDLTIITGALEGPGIYCIGGISTNNGSILGPMDFCDLTPPPDSPWVDVPGFITGVINYCQSGLCMPNVGIERDESPPLNFDVTVTNGRLIIISSDANLTNLFIDLIDLQGRMVLQKEINKDQSSILLSKHLMGIYLYRISDLNGILGQGKLLIK